VIRVGLLGLDAADGEHRFSGDVHVEAKKAAAIHAAAAKTL
jgi:hypothetical protein